MNLFILIALLVGSLAGAADSDRCPADLEWLSRPSPRIDRLATSVGEHSLFTVAAAQGKLYQLSDRAERLGMVRATYPELLPLEVKDPPWKRIAQLAVLSQSDDPSQPGGLVAVANEEGEVCVLTFPQIRIAHVKPVLDEWTMAISIAEPRGPQLAIFTTKGIRTANLPLLGGATAASTLRARIDGIRGGVSVGRDDFVYFDKHGNVVRWRDSRKTPLFRLAHGVRSVTAYIENRQLRVWAVDADGTLWVKANRTSPLSLSSYQTSDPNTVQIVAGGRTMQGNAFGGTATEGALSHQSSSGNKVWVQRLLALGADGSVSSPWNDLQAPSMTPYFPRLGLNAQDPGLSFSPHIEIQARGTQIEPSSVSYAMATLREFTSPFHLSDDWAEKGMYRDILLSTWFDHLRAERVIQTPGSGVPSLLASYGVPSDLAHQLIFLDAVKTEDRVAILTNGSVVHRRARLTLASNFLHYKVQYIDWSDEAGDFGRSLIENLLTKYCSDPRKMFKVLARYVRAHSRSNETLYQFLGRFLPSASPLWQWRLGADAEEAALFEQIRERARARVTNGTTRP